MVIAIDSDREYECAWSPQLRPSGEGTFDKETFDQWWRKAKPFIPHLHPQIAEQWIYKHWTNSPYCYLPLQNLDWRCEKWKTDAIFRDIFVRPSFGPNQPESDFKFFADRNYSGREPWKTIRSTGSWNYPIVVILTPDGLRSEGVASFRALLLNRGTSEAALFAGVASARVVSGSREAFGFRLKCCRRLKKYARPMR